MAQDTDPRLLRSFVAVAEELHFTRAAARLFVAQQALSRDIARLERAWETTLFVRSTRRVALTPAGTRLLPLAREVLAGHARLAAEVGRGERRPLVVDVAAPGATGHRVLDAAREAAPEVEFVARFRSGLAGAALEVLDGRLDVSFGRVAGLAPAPRAELAHRLIRFERLAVLLPVGHRLAELPRLPLAALAGETIYAAAGNQDTTEWTDYARTLFAAWDIRLAAPFPKVEGDAEFSRTVLRQGWSVLINDAFMEIPGTVARPLVDPVPLSPVSMVWRRGTRHPGLTVLLEQAGLLGAAEGWSHRPSDHWLPEADRALLAEAGALG
ncbi:LysR family transcriptional regulator [Streptomyces profundus]|uniref:LysR family transcriptional regulator n=1 Tax=Streptomyces profundus TaxID=2867410 RepID=UPI001D16AFD9|nr:LysR family transcriptional regulator [Streptomyces sp. MA3_2.13]UED86048.1 LysR family transcriptional regulator [Streptomyces sp. MA3_2.13]